MERLQADRIREVGRVRVGWESNVSVCCVLGRQVGGEVIEATVMRFADEGDIPEHGFGCFRRSRDVVHITEAVHALGGTSIPGMRNTRQESIVYYVFQDIVDRSLFTEGDPRGVAGNICAPELESMLR